MRTITGALKAIKGEEGEEKRGRETGRQGERMGGRAGVIEEREMGREREKKRRVKREEVE